MAKRHYHVTYSTQKIGRSAATIKSNTDGTGRSYRNGTCFLGGMACGAAKLEKKGEKLFVIKKCSHIANVEQVKKIRSQRVEKMRRAYKDKISSLGILRCDVPCKSMSEAALFVRGTQTNGKKFWQKM